MLHKGVSYEKILVIGSTVVDVIVNLGITFPKPEKMSTSKASICLFGGCAYNVSDSIPPLRRSLYPLSPLWEKAPTETSCRRS